MAGHFGGYRQDSVRTQAVLRGTRVRVPKQSRRSKRCDLASHPAYGIGSGYRCCRAAAVSRDNAIYGDDLCMMTRQ